jgi:tRNA (adenine57-N1/adenine58-N1)-methyltransferase
MPVDVLKAGDVALLVSRDRKQYLLRLQSGQTFHMSRGMIRHDDLIGQPAGREVRTHMDYPVLVLEASTADLVRRIKRTTQIMFPKDISYVLMRLNLYPGRRVIEAGTGSGGLALALARQVMPTGHVYSYDSKPEVQDLARSNLEMAGLLPYVDLKARDIEAGFDETDVDSLFLDVRYPWRYLGPVAEALKPGGYFGAITPTTNQVVDLLEALQRHGEFAFTEVEELILRPYKAVPARLRPMDRIIAHTGFLVFARRVVGGLDEGWSLPARVKKHRARELENGPDNNASRPDDEDVTDDE